MRSAIAMIMLASVSACASEGPRAPATTTQAIIEGEPGDHLVGIAHISHVGGLYTCSGVLIAPELVLTAKHCVFTRGSETDAPLSPEGFRIGFGSTTDNLTRRGVVQLAWIGMPESLSVLEAVEAGQDIAILVLDEPAPVEEIPHEPALAFSPIDQQPVRMAGFGLVDASGVSGIRSVGSGAIVGFDPDPGIIEVEGDSACFGDSGGPVLDDTQARVLGIIGEIGEADEPCSTGLTFASTSANEGVQRFLARQCAGVGGCGRRASNEGDGGPRSPQDASGLDSEVEGDSSEPDEDGGSSGPDSSARDAMPDATDANPSGAISDGGCAAARPSGAGRLSAQWVTTLLLVSNVWLARRRRRFEPRASSR